MKDSHLFKCELKLSCVEQQLEKDLRFVLGVIKHLVFDLTKALVVWVIGYETEDDWSQINTLFSPTSPL